MQNVPWCPWCFNEENPESDARVSWNSGQWHCAAHYVSLSPVAWAQAMRWAAEAQSFEPSEYQLDVDLALAGGGSTELRRFKRNPDSPGGETCAVCGKHISRHFGPARTQRCDGCPCYCHPKNPGPCPECSTNHLPDE